MAKKRERNIGRGKRGPAYVVAVNDRMQRDYSYLLTEPTGRNFDRGFRPELTPKEMLALGVFCGKYMTDCQKEFPASWFAHAKLSPRGRDCSLNYFGVDASQPLSMWRKKRWMHCRQSKNPAGKPLWRASLFNSSSSIAFYGP